MDDDTLMHFQRWLDKHVIPEEHILVFDRIAKLWCQDPEFCSTKSWSELRDISSSLN